MGNCLWSTNKEKSYIMTIYQFKKMNSEMKSNCKTNSEKDLYEYIMTTTPLRSNYSFSTLSGMIYNNGNYEICLHPLSRILAYERIIPNATITIHNEIYCDMYKLSKGNRCGNCDNIFCRCKSMLKPPDYNSIKKTLL